MSLILKGREIVPCIAGFTDGNDRARSLLRFYDKFLKLIIFLGNLVTQNYSVSSTIL